MFTGIIEDVGTLTTIERTGSSARLVVRAGRVIEGVAIGESIAVSGVCLTVVEIDGQNLSFDAVPETLHRTNLGDLDAGDRVNLERSLRLSDRLGGHIVQGHVDGTATLIEVEERDNAHVLTIGAPSELMRYIAPKGSIAVDGISLTVVDVGSESFTVWIIPHTYAHTTLGDRKTGDRLNLEIDLLARYIERLLQSDAQRLTLNT